MAAINKVYQLLSLFLLHIVDIWDTLLLNAVGQHEF